MTLCELLRKVKTIQYRACFIIPFTYTSKVAAAHTQKSNGSNSFRSSQEEMTLFLCEHFQKQKRAQFGSSEKGSLSLHAELLFTFK